MHHPDFGTVHLHDHQQDGGDRDVFHGVTMYADRGLQLVEPAVTVGDPVLHPQPDHVIREFDQQQCAKHHIERAYHF
ncbi:hypothetical protein D3C75_1093680 [compost metagenome]